MVVAAVGEDTEDCFIEAVADRVAVVVAAGMEVTGVFIEDERAEACGKSFTAVV